MCIRDSYGFILNPDVVLRDNTIDEIIIASKKVDTFSIIAPIMEEEDYPNFKLSKKKDLKDLNYEPFKVDSVEQTAVFESDIILVLEPLVLAPDLESPSVILVI